MWCSGVPNSQRATVIVTVSVPDETRFLTAAFLNETITETEGAGFLRVSGTDSSGAHPGSTSVTDGV
jgi:hypothetical protein